MLPVRADGIAQEVRTRRGWSSWRLLPIVSGLLLSIAFGLSPASAAAGPCDQPVQNPVVCENSKAGTPSSEWDVEGAGDPAIQGFATDISVDHGQMGLS